MSNPNSGLCDPKLCDHEPIKVVHVPHPVEFTWHTLPAGVYPVHHMAPWGPVLYEVNDLGHRLSLNKNHVAHC